MPVTDYSKYIITEPILEAGPKYELKNRMNPSMTYLSRDLLPEALQYLEFGWVWGIPEPNPHTPEHMHRFDEFVLHMGSDYLHQEDLGAEVENRMGGVPLVFDTTSCLFVPRWLRHGPLTWKKYRNPHIQMTLTVGTGRISDGWVDIEGEEAKKSIAAEVKGTDYGKYMVKNPVSTASADDIKGRHPWMTLMNNELVPGCHTTIQSRWVYDLPEPAPRNPKNRHDGDTIILFIGSDWQNPHRLGAEIEFMMGKQKLTINKTSAMFIPKGIEHGKMKWKSFQKPHLQLCIFLCM